MLLFMMFDTQYMRVQIQWKTLQGELKKNPLDVLIYFDLFKVPQCYLILHRVWLRVSILFVIFIMKCAKNILRVSIFTEAAHENSAWRIAWDSLTRTASCMGCVHCAWCVCVCVVYNNFSPPERRSIAITSIVIPSQSN